MTIRLIAILALAPVLLGNFRPQIPDLSNDERESWIVTFKTRSFDLSLFRSAIRDKRRAADVAEIVTVLGEKARRDQSDFVRYVTGLGGRVTHQWWLINGCAIDVPVDQVPAIRRHTAVDRVYENRTLRPGWIKTATNARNHHVDGLHSQGIQGSGTTIAIIDSGLDSDMNGTARPHRTFFVNGDVTNTSGGGIGGSRLLANIKVGAQSADDILGHGTMVAAVAGGEIWGTANGDPGHAPEAGIVGYSIADTNLGAALLTTMVTAIQQMAADKRKYNISVGNLSYEGSAVPSWPEQQALDAAVLNADIFIAVLGGNGAASTHFSHAATNVLAVGATEADLHTVASFSSRGPIQPGRTFPDIVANGVNTIGPLADNESADRVASGTSNASPQVAGAAALYRSIKTAATALETRAALLATTQNISFENSNSVYASSNAYGQGYLRDDELIKVAQGGGSVQNSSLSPTTTTRTYQFNVTAGKFYSAAVAWYRYNTALNKDWSDLALSVSMGATTLATSDAALNTYEKVQFEAKTTGSVTFTVTANSFEVGVTSLPISLVMVESLPYTVKIPAVVATIGRNCLGSLTIISQTFGPVISLIGDPALGKTHTVNLSLMLPNTRAILAVGLSSSTWGPLSLPYDLTPLGGTGCSIYTSLDFLFPLQASSGLVGVATTVFSIPNNSALTGLGYFLQGAADDAAANPLGMTTTQALSVRIGN